MRARQTDELGKQIGDKERELNGHFFRWVAKVETGDLDEAEAYLVAAERIADELRQPAQYWQVISSRAMLALAPGRLGEAEELVASAYAWGEQALPGGIAPAVCALQQYTLCELRDRLEEVEPLIEELVVDYPARPVFRCVLAHLQARQGRTTDPVHSSAIWHKTASAVSRATWNGSSA